MAFPRVTMEQPRLRFHRVASPDDLRVGAYGILEPRAECPEVAAEEVDLFLIPGLAFDRTGGRLGYGGGYYDEVGALVRRHGRAAMFGFGFDFQIVDSCPMGPDDVTIDGIVTDARVLRCGLSQTESTSK